GLGRPAVVVRRAVRVHGRNLQAVGGVVGRAGPTLVLAVLPHQQPAAQRAVLGREADGVAVAIAPREGLDCARRVLGVDAGPQDGARADALVVRARESRDHRPGPLDAERRVSAGLDPAAGVEHGAAERDVLAGDVLLPDAAAVVTTHHA